MVRREERGGVFISGTAGETADDVFSGRLPPSSWSVFFWKGMIKFSPSVTPLGRGGGGRSIKSGLDAHQTALMHQGG